MRVVLTYLAALVVVVIAALITAAVISSLTARGEREDDPPASVVTDLGATSHDAGYYDGSCPDARLPECANAPPPPGS